MAVTELAYRTETEIDNGSLTLDLLRLLSNKRFFGGKLGGKNILTEEMGAYRQYCQQIGSAIVSQEGITYPIEHDIDSPRGIIYGLAVPNEFTDQLLAFPEAEIRLLVVAAAMQRNKIMTANGQGAQDRYDLVAKCEDCFNHAADWINGHYYGFSDFLSQNLV